MPSILQVKRYAVSKIDVFLRELEELFCILPERIMRESCKKIAMLIMKKLIFQILDKGYVE